MGRDMGRDASGESGFLLALRRRVWRVLPRFAKRHLYAPLFYHANCFWLAYCAVTTVMETVIIVRASLDGCVSILTPSPEAPRCLPPFFKLYDIITNKGEVAVPTNALVVFARFIFLSVVLLKRIVEARRPATTDADEARESSKARLSAVSSQSWQPDVTHPVSKGLGGLPARIWDMFVISDWSVVASEDVFDEMLSAMRSAVVDLLVLTAVKSALNTIPGILSEFGSIGWDWTKSSARTFAYLSAVCGDSPKMTLCHFTYLNRRWISDCNIDMEVIIYTVFMMMPIGVFHQLTFLVGNAKTKYKRFLSILLVWIPLIICVVQRGIWGYYIYSGLATNVFTGNATKTEIEIFFTTRAVSTGLVLMVLLLLFDVDLIVFKPLRWLGINLGFFSSQQTQPHVVSGLASNGGSERSWSFREVLRHWYAPRGSGLVVRRMMFMFFSYQTFAPAGHAYGYARFWLTWVTRVVFFLMILVQRDGESSFEDLKKDGAGFGLLVDAEDLRRSVTAATQGGRYGRRLRKYKGTMFRMQDTLVVSYRWQSCKTELTDGTGINMSLWQLEQLLNALNNTGCRYAWIDALAIPQDNSPLQGLLITRMMAIYSSCRECLILRTVEEEGSRYHQRAWTFQEWCACNNPVVATQSMEDTPSAEDLEICASAGNQAVTPAENSTYAQYRAQLQSRMGRVKPMWLFSMRHMDYWSDMQFSHLWRQVVQVSGQVNCQVPMDRVRAIFPTMWNTPTSSHEELRALVNDVLARANHLGLLAANKESNAGDAQIAYSSPHSHAHIPLQSPEGKITTVSTEEESDNTVPVPSPPVVRDRATEEVLRVMKLLADG